MALLPPKDAAVLRQRFERELAEPVTLRLFTTSTGGLTVPGMACELCPPTQQLLEAVAALDSRLRLQVHSIVTEAEATRAAGVVRVPAILIGRGGDGRVRFYGIPAGLEFGVLIEALIAASRGHSGLAPESRRLLAGLPRPVHIQVFVTPTCPYCPRVGRLAWAMALESPQVRADVVEISEFPDLATRYHVRGVPKVVIDETDGFEGALPEAAFVAHVVQAASRPAPVAAGQEDAGAAGTSSAGGDLWLPH